MIPVVSKHYCDFYTWSHCLGDQLIAHSDGAVSCLIEWDGFDLEMSEEHEISAVYTKLYGLLAQFENNFVYEFHLWREHDNSVAEKYRNNNNNIVRGGKFAKLCRNALADHMSKYGITNEVGLIVTALPKKKAWGAKRFLNAQVELGNHLLRHAAQLCNKLSGAIVAKNNRYISRIIQSYDRKSFDYRDKLFIDPLLPIADQLICAAPTVQKGNIVQGGEVSKVLYVYLYPDAEPGWITGIACMNIPMHISQIIMPVNTKKAIHASESESTMAEGGLGRRGGAFQRQQIKDLANFREYVAENNLSIYKNAYVIHLHGSHEKVDQQGRFITDWIESNGGQVRQEPYTQLPYWRVAQPGQGYCSPLLRPDHTLQIANMAPVQVYRNGHSSPESLRVGESGQLVGFNYTKQPVLHSFTVAMTGAGKGVDKVATIAETFPLGLDWYIAEIGECYRWLVEAYGGTYTKVDPRETVINPLPPYSVANSHADLPLDSIIAGGTVNALAFLLTDGSTKLDVHQRRVAQSALQILYAEHNNEGDAPVLPDYLEAIESIDFEKKEQIDAAEFMSSNLSSFLETTEGRIFENQDTLSLSDGITGVDLKDVDKASPQLLQFYLVFLSLRFSHLAFARRRTTIILLDEMHKFIASSETVVSRLISEIARMGRKDAAAIDIVTQGITEIDSIEKEVLNSMPLRTLLYRADEHNAIASRIDMPTGPRKVWERFPYPLEYNYRPCLRSVGDQYYNLHLTFPDLLLDLASSSPADLDAKDRIGSSISDPFERMLKFRNFKEKGA